MLKKLQESKSYRKVRQWCSTVGQFVSCDGMTRNITMISACCAAKVQAVVKRGKRNRSLFV
jgi:hypothetical protein